MAYPIAWGIYLSMAALLMFGFERYVAGYVVHQQTRIAVRALLAIVLFTPGMASGESSYVVPACVGVLFNLLSHSGQGLLKAMLPLLFSAALVFAVLFIVEAMRKDEEGEEHVSEEESAE